MNKNVIRGAAAASIVACALATPSQAAIVYSAGFDGLSSQPALNTVPTGWTSTSGTVDWIYSNNSWGISCHNGSAGCVDLDGSTWDAGLLSTAFTLQSGVEYQLSAFLRGNQRGYGAETVTFGFLDSSNNVLSSTTTSSIASGDPYQLVSLPSYTPSGNQAVRIFFQANGAGDNVGPILDDVSLTAVPLPAAAWLLLSGLVGFGALGRRKVAA